MLRQNCLVISGEDLPLEAKNSITSFQGGKWLRKINGRKSTLRCFVIMSCNCKIHHIFPFSTKSRQLLETRRQLARLFASRYPMISSAICFSPWFWMRSWMLIFFEKKIELKSYNTASILLLLFSIWTRSERGGPRHRSSLHQLCRAWRVNVC